ncbi:MAG TPA: hypothetical protein VF498_08240, partial [Anaerolineales bacterium]
MKLVTVAEMQAIEQEANAAGLTYEQMMENAGQGLAEVVAGTYGDLKQEGVMGLVGSGSSSQVASGRRPARAGCNGAGIPRV